MASTITIEKTFTIDDSPADVTSCKLSDPTGAYGVKRNDTDAVVVADGTDMTKKATGVYRHTFTEPAVDLTYTYWTEWVYAGETYREEGTVEGAVTGTVVTVAEAKDHLRVTHSDDDSYIETLIKAASAHAAYFQGRTYLQKQRVEYYDGFFDIIKPPYPPLVSVDSIQYVDVDGVTQTVSSDDYRIDTGSEPGRITPAYGKAWPATRSVTNAVILTYQAGYSSRALVPDEIKHAVLLLVGHLYEHRESVTEAKLIIAPQSYYSLLWPLRILIPSDL